MTAPGRRRCEYCHYPQGASNTSLEIEHIIPLSKRGETLPENLALACRRCNSHKSNKTDGIDTVTGERMRLFNPRLDDWNLHFHLNVRTGEIEGQTAIGRMTVQGLSMNEPMAVANRCLLIEIGLLPVHNER
ncbi:HNH endonuclease [Candidatus Poribacteria bacterium]|nr:HNH endonuclease [Candidatus Poribacteria bacterium]